MAEYGVIIVAAGGGSRMGGEVPKQFLPLGAERKPVLLHTLERLAAALPGALLVVVLPQGEQGRWAGICRAFPTPEHTLCVGGANRWESVGNALPLTAGCEIVGVHDGVRPLVSPQLVAECFATARAHGTAVPVVKPVDSFRIVDGDPDAGLDAGLKPDAGSDVELRHTGSAPFDRNRLRAVQTPQVFRRSLLAEAYLKPYDDRYTDDATAVEHAGIAVTLCEGRRTNIKITTPDDVILAEALLAAGH